MTRILSFSSALMAVCSQTLRCSAARRTSSCASARPHWTIRTARARERYDFWRAAARRRFALPSLASSGSFTDREYKRAAPAFLNVKTNTAVRAKKKTSLPISPRKRRRPNTAKRSNRQSFDHRLGRVRFAASPASSAGIPEFISRPSSCKCRISLRAWSPAKAPPSPHRAPARA